LNIKKVY